MERAELSQDISGRGAVEASGYEGLSRAEGDGFTLSLFVPGIYCAACIYKIENAVQQHQDVRKAHVNFSTRSVSIHWGGTPEQGNQFVNDIQSLGYEVHPYDIETENAHAKKEERFLLFCLGIAGFAAGNIMLLSLGLWMTTIETMGAATRDFIHIISALIALPAIAFAGRPFFRSALSALKHGQTNMDVPISVALLLACGMSVHETMRGGEHVYFDSAVMLMFFLLVGRYLDFRARKQARSAANDLAKTLSGFTQLENGQRIAIKDLEPGMKLLVAMGEKMPADGRIISGETSLDVSLINGESAPQGVRQGDQVYAGTLNLSAPVTIEVSAQTDDSLLSKIIKLMEQAEQNESAYVHLADRAAAYYTPIVHILALAAFLGWVFVGGLDWQPAMMIAVTVLIITCPCALGLAVPVVQVLAIGKLLKQGVIVKSGDALERLAEIDTIMFDKTGTLTRGKPVLIGDYKSDHLDLAAALARHSHHPLARAIISDQELPDVIGIQEHPGQGIEAQWQGKVVKLGSRAWCGDQNTPHADNMEMWLNIDGDPICAFYLTDALREDAEHTIQNFHDKQTLIASGDREAPVKVAAETLCIETWYAEQKPSEKYKILQGLQSQGHKALMVGDGLNDAPVLAGAHVSMAPGTALDVAQNTADIVFMSDRLAPVYITYQTAQRAQGLVRQNMALAIIYNILAIPLALTGQVTPLIAALAMSGSSLIVIANSFRLKLSS